MSKSNGSEIIFRQATLEDVRELVLLEEAVWMGNGASEDKIISRIRVFPEGNIIAILDEEIVGYTCLEWVDDVRNKAAFSWDEITDMGYLKKSHNPKGCFLYGVNLSVHHSVNGMNVGTLLLLEGWKNMIINNKQGAFTGSRIPGFCNYKKKFPHVSVEEYVVLRRKNGKLRDYELHLYELEGINAVKILPDYFPDPESLNYGVLVFRKNPFYNWPFKRFFAWVISKAAAHAIRKNFLSKKGDTGGSDEISDADVL